MRINKDLKSIMTSLACVFMLAYALFPPFITIFKAGPLIMGSLLLSIFISLIVLFVQRRSYFNLYVILWGIMLIIGVFYKYQWNIKIDPYSLMFISIFLFILIYKNNDDWIKVALAMFLIAGGVYSFTTLLSYFSPDIYKSVFAVIYPDKTASLIRLYNRGCIAGLFDHYSSNGMALALAVGSFGCFLFSDYVKKYKFAIWSMLVVISISLLLTGKRGHIIFSLGAIFVTYYFASADKKRGRIFKIIGALLAAIVAFLIVSQFIPAINIFVERFAQLAEEGNIDANRSDLYKLAWQFFVDSPLFGIGWDGYQTYYSKFLGMDIDAHNIYLQLLCETGVIGFSIFVIAFYKMYRLTISIYKEKLIACKEGYYKYALTFSIFIQTFFLMYGFTGNPLYHFMMFVPYGLAWCITLYYYYELRFVDRKVVEI